DDHAGAHVGKRNALAFAILVSLIAFVLQLVGSWYTGSLALFGDSAHLATDLFSLVMSLAAIMLAVRPASAWRSYGFFRMEVLSSFLNGLLLLLVSLALAEESVSHLWNPAPVKVKPLILIASLGL